ncbi:Nif3-like dinuclear metal center hexameric protein [Stieleria sp. TO1_6]|uniref:Nif3-like dinuclear metal center hexameric protein n=1 Tax=Stieleria tagensis TaxID=2956795 RepID=UPI00209BB467|nr:Nif3-like dinuclear metal center hexameric protein [Stieleria tagensis]MCO8122236.1 Nif3-like dinuclear metal center hexameric protein [Stieleria tagensis]
MTVSLDALCQTLAQLAPLALAESWDNVGLLLGDRSQLVDRVMTCLTITPAVVDEAIEQRAGLIVAHHPLPFRPLARINCDSVTGRMLWRLAGAGIAVYSAHTAFDSAASGINQQWAESLGLTAIRPLLDPDVTATELSGNRLGSGRFGSLPVATAAVDVIRQCHRHVGSSVPLRAVGPLHKLVTKIGFACGSGGSFVAAADRHGCELLITGEATFHNCLEAESLGMVLGLLGHYHSERFAMEILADQIASALPGLSIWPSRCESDPIQVVAE